MRAPEVAPRLSGGVAHAMAVYVASSCRDSMFDAAEAPRVCRIERARLRLRFSGRSGPALSGKMLARKPVDIPRVLAGQLLSWKWWLARVAFDVDLRPS